MPADPDLIAALRPVRLPHGFEAFSWPVVCAAFSLGILLALLVVQVLRLVTERRESRLAIVRRTLAAASRLPAEERLFAQAALLDRLSAEQAGASDTSARAVASARTPTARAVLRRTIGEQLYKPGAAPDFGAIDASILRLAAARPVARGGRGLWPRRRPRETGDESATPASRSPLLAAGAARPKRPRNRWQAG